VTTDRVLLEGRPGIGKTTVARRLVELLREKGVAVTGFTTEEIREGRRRVGFAVEAVSGERGTLAHVTLPGPPRVGKYGVDLAAFEAIALPQMREPPRGGVVVVDEIGKMELASPAFREAVTNLLGKDVAVVATVHVFRHPFTDELKRRPKMRLIRVSPGNRGALPRELAELAVR
jgi:nucleoside-triphosphatase